MIDSLLTVVAMFIWQFASLVYIIAISKYYM